MNGTLSCRGGLTPPRHLYGILGMPLGHSLSPLLHTWGFAESGHPGAYFAWEKQTDDLPAFFHAVRNLPIAGLSVTIPHKQAVIPFLDGVTEQAATVGAVNTVFWREGKLMGGNTDVQGFTAPLARITQVPRNALVLGAGGACRAVLAGLAGLGFDRIVIIARNAAKAAALAGDFGCLFQPWQQRDDAPESLAPCVVVNTTPLGMKGTHADASPLSESALARLARAAAPERAASLVYDIVYSPRETPLLHMAGKHGIPTLDGLGFLVSQGLEQFRLWTGISLPYQPAFALLANALDNTAH